MRASEPGRECYRQTHEASRCDAIITPARTRHCVPGFYKPSLWDEEGRALAVADTKKAGHCCPAFSNQKGMSSSSSWYSPELAGEAPCGGPEDWRGCE
jgi:hypothetical protein